MRKYFLCAIVFSLTACGGTEESVHEDPSHKTENNDTIITPEGVTIVSEYSTPEEGHVWQIGDYAEHLVNAKISLNADQMIEEGTMYYYASLLEKNGYAQVAGSFDGTYTFALWRMANGHDLVGYESMGCGPVCDYVYFFYEFDNGVKKDITEHVLPLNQMDEFSDQIYPNVIEKYPNIEYQQDWFYRYELPAEGTSMKVFYVVGAEEFEMPMFLLTWDKKKFSIKEKYSEIPDLK